MTDLIAILGTGKGTWGYVSKLLRQGNFEKVILFTNTFGRQNYVPDEIQSDKITLIVVDFDSTITDLQKEMFEKLKPLITGTEVALNFISGAGKEHMALLSVVLKLGLGVRLVAAGENSFLEL